MDRQDTDMGFPSRVCSALLPCGGAFILSACGPTLDVSITGERSTDASAPSTDGPLYVATDTGTEPEPEPEDTAPPAPPPPVAIGTDGYFYLDGEKALVVGVEEERNLLSDADVDALVPALRDAGFRFVIIYMQNRQTDYFYDRLEAEGLYVAQHLGTLKEETGEGFSGTGGVIGTVPSEEWYEARLADIEATVPALAEHGNILFWWLGGEFVEPEFHSEEGTAVIRDHVERYREAIRALDPLQRPFTVSHHYVEAIIDPLLPWIDYGDRTDFTWFTVATHFHLGDFVEGGGWWPIAQASEPSFLLEPVLQHAYALNGRQPVFFGGLYGQAPLLGPCVATGQHEQVHDKWDAISGVPNIGFSTYHLDEWDDNDIPHALYARDAEGFTLTEAGEAFREIAAELAAVE